MAGRDILCLQQTHPSKDRGKAKAVVTNAWSHQAIAFARHLDRGAFGKDCVEMGRDNEHRAICGSGPQREHIAFSIDGHIGQPGIAQHCGEQFRTHLLLERRSGGFGDADQVCNYLIILAIQIGVQRC